MISVESALKIFKEKMPKWGVVDASLADIHSGETTIDLVADRDYPPFHRAMMDGIAVSWSAYNEGQRSFLIAGVCAAGAPQVKLQSPSSCVEIMTGAPVPDHADLIIPYEDLQIENGSAKLLRESPRSKMDFIHLKSSDAIKGDVLLGKGAQLNGPHWGIAASLGYTKVTTTRKPRINIVSTGDELVAVGATPLAHQIRRSNAYALQASLQLHGFNQTVLSHLDDEISAIETHYQQSRNHFDLMIYSGGVSKGKFDFLPETWKSLGITEHIHGIAQRPGKPLWFGVDERFQTAVIGLPGNPVSSLVCLHRYFLGRMPSYAQLTEDVVFKKDLTFFVPVRIESATSGVLRAHPLSIKNSGEFSALAGSDGFLELPRERSLFKSGEAFLFHSWRP